MKVRGWLIVGDALSAALPQERFRGAYPEWPNAELYQPGDWIHVMGTAAAVCVDVPLG